MSVKRRKTPSPSRERPKSDIAHTVRWADAVEDVPETGTVKKREGSYKLRQKPRPKSDFGELVLVLYGVDKNALAVYLWDWSITQVWVNFSVGHFAQLTVVQTVWLRFASNVMGLLLQICYHTIQICHHTKSHACHRDNSCLE